MRKIAIFMLIFLWFSGCTSDEKPTEKGEIALAVENITKNTEQIVASMSEIAEHAAAEADNLAGVAAKTAENMTEALAKSVEDIKDVAKEQITSAAKAGEEALNKIDKAVQEATVEVANKSKNTSAATKISSNENGKKVFAKCIVCHGKQANLKALNNSQDISKWSAESITASLKGYKDGTYGGKFKASMAPMVKPLSESDMNDVAAYITTLN